MPPVADSVAKAKVRHQLSNPDFLYRSPSIEKLPKIQQVLQYCFQSPAHLRPSASLVSNALLETFTELSYAKSLSPPDPERTSADLLAAKDRCYSLVRQARNGKHTHPDRPEKVSDADLDLLVKHGEADATSPSDPPCSFLIGALVWWHLVENSQCTDRFGITDSGKY